MTLSFTGMPGTPKESTKMLFSETQKFQKEFKKLTKDYRSLPRDLEVFKKVAEVSPIDPTGCVSTVLTSKSGIDIIKVRLACASQRKSSNASNLRVIYAYNGDADRIDFIEIFKKNSKREDKKRYEAFLSEFG